MRVIKHVSISSWVALLTLGMLGLTSCDRGESGGASAVRTLSTAANNIFVQELSSGRQVSLESILNSHRQYGLSTEQLDSIRDDLTDEDIDRMVFNFVDPNSLGGSAQPRFAFVDEGSEDDGSLEELEVVSRDGEISVIDGTSNPDVVPFPVITLGYDETLQAASSMSGSTSISTSTSQLDTSSSSGSSTTAMMLDYIRFDTVSEPWVLGDAEIYLIVSYIGRDGVGASELIELPAVDEALVRYNTRKILHIWDKNKYQITNVAVFEHDSDTDYADVAGVFLDAAKKISTAVTTATGQVQAGVMIALVLDLADSIIKVLPESALIDEADFVDNINTIEKTFNGTRMGVGMNVEMEFSAYDLQEN